MKIYFTQNAKTDYLQLFDYLKEEWGQNLANRFTKKMIGILELLSIFPNMGVLEVEPKKIRSYPITKQVRIFYTIEVDMLIVLALVDLRKLKQ